MSMRLDKFLKVSRLIKRRTLAKEVADQGRISINGLQAKASSNVKEGDELTVRFGQKLVTVRINKIVRDYEKRGSCRNVYGTERRTARRRAVRGGLFYFTPSLHTFVKNSVNVRDENEPICRPELKLFKRDCARA